MNTTLRSKETLLLRQLKALGLLVDRALSRGRWERLAGLRARRLQKEEELHDLGREADDLQRSMRGIAR